MAGKKNTPQTPMDKLQAQVDTIRDRVETELKVLEKRYHDLVPKARLDDLLKNLDKQFEGWKTQVVHAAGLATINEVEQLRKKLNAVSRKVNGINKEAA